MKVHLILPILLLALANLSTVLPHQIWHRSHVSTKIECEIKGEVYKECGTDPRCVPTCKGIRERSCNAKCNAGCYCPEGCVRRNPPSDPKCVPEDQCPATDRRRPGRKHYHDIEQQHILPGESGGSRKHYHDIEHQHILPGESGGSRKHYHDIEQQHILPGESGGRRKHYPEIEQQKILPGENGGNSDIASESNCARKGEVFAVCGKDPRCLPTCKDPVEKPCSHPGVCYAGCYCPQGFWRINPPSDKRCVRKDQCPAFRKGHTGSQVSIEIECKIKGEVYKECGTDPRCVPTCKGKRERQCHAKCYIGCYCPEGFVRRNPPYDPKCVPEDRCPDTGRRVTGFLTSYRLPKPPCSG